MKSYLAIIAVISSVNLFAQLSHEDSVLIQSYYTISTSSPKFNLYSSSTDSYILSHVSSKIDLSSLDSTSLENFNKLKTTKDFLSQFHDKTNEHLNVDSAEYHRRMQQGYDLLAYGYTMEAIQEFRAATFYKINDPAALNILNQLLKIDQDTIVVTPLKPNYLLIDKNKNPISIHTPPVQIVLQNADTTHYSGYVQTVVFDALCSSVITIYYRYENGQLIKSNKYLCPVNIDQKKMTPGVIDSIVLNFTPNKCKLISQSNHNVDKKEFKETLFHGTDSATIKIARIDSTGLWTMETTRLDNNNDTLYYCHSTSNSRSSHYYNSMGVMTHILTKKTDSSGVEHYLEYDSQRELVFWSTKDIDLITNTFYFRIESFEYELTINYDKHGNIDFVNDNQLYLFSGTLIPEHNFINNMYRYDKFEFNIFFVKLSDYDTDYVPVIYSTNSLFDPTDPRDVAWLHKKLVRYKQRQDN